MFEIEKLKNDYIPEFNKRSIGMEIRGIKDKVNELVDAVNAMMEPDYTSDIDDDDDEGEAINLSNLRIGKK